MNSTDTQNHAAQEACRASGRRRLANRQRERRPHDARTGDTCQEDRVRAEIVVVVRQEAAVPPLDARDAVTNLHVPLRLDVVFRVTDAQVEQIAQQAAELLAREPTGQQGGWLRGAEQIAAYIDCPRSRVYALASAGRIPVERDGTGLIARRSELDAWIRGGGGKRP
jgi:excisionase family DNA binding protein